MTVEALARHEACQSDSNVAFPDIESLSIGATSAAKSSCTWASHWTDCTNVTFSKVLQRFATSNLAQHKEVSRIFGRLFVKRFALCYWTVVLSCLSVTLVYCSQMVGRIKMKRLAGRPRPRRLCVRWGPSSPPKKGHSPTPIFSRCLLWPDGSIDQDATWYRGRPRPRRHCV